MSAFVLGLCLLLIVILGIRLSSTGKEESLETRDVADVDEAISKIKQSYPNAVNGPWQPDREGWLPAGEVMAVWQDQEALDRNSPPVAWIRRYCP
jgi:hypothetical protein